MALKNALIGLLAVGGLAAGCKSSPPPTTGFLGDYSRLEPFEDGLRYVDEERLGGYSAFMIDPVILYFHDEQKEAGMSAADRRDLAAYMQNAVTKALSDKYGITYQAGPGVARIRLALTDIEMSQPVLNIIPTTKLTGIGLGGVSAEFELLDSESGEQIAAAVLSQKGSRLSLSGLSRTGDAEAIMDDWAQRLRSRLDEARGSR